MLTILLCCLALNQRPILVPATRDTESWVVPFAVDGNRTSRGLMLDSDMITTAVSGDWMVQAGLDLGPGARHTLRVGRWAIGRATVHPGDLERLPGGNVYDGIAGLDILSKAAIGFDKTTSTVAIWPGGKIPEAEAKRWVVSGARWPGDPNKPGFWKGTLGRDAQGFPTVVGAVGGKAAKFRIRLAGDSFEVPKEAAADLVAVPLAGGYLTKGVQVGPGCAWCMFAAVSAPADGIEPDEPTVSINAFHSRRVILDFPAGKIYAQRLQGPALAAFAFSKFVPLHLQGGKPVIGPARNFPTLMVRAAPDSTAAR